jgi:hypothetical protein
LRCHCCRHVDYLQEIKKLVTTSNTEMWRRPRPYTLL